uniref:Uncharacterized protein n=1 Tax=Anguilla anguilla TaxID=7936 RepID=A0A0E9R7Z9_ANGAN
MRKNVLDFMISCFVYHIQHNAWMRKT